jgi:hypothetical protein
MKKLIAIIFAIVFTATPISHADIIPEKPIFDPSEHCVVDPLTETVISVDKKFDNGSLLKKYGIKILYPGVQKILTTDILKYQQALQEYSTWSSNFVIQFKILLPENIYENNQCGMEKYRYEQSIVEYNTPDGTCTNFWLYPNKTKYKYEVVGESHRLITTRKLLESNSKLNAIGEREFYPNAILKLEPNNKFDRYAVMVLINNKHVGYVPADFAKYMTQYIKSTKKSQITVPACMGSAGGWPQVNLNMDPFLKSIKKTIIAWRDGTRTDR